MNARFRLEFGLERTAAFARQSVRCDTVHKLSVPCGLLHQAHSASLTVILKFPGIVLCWC